MAQVFRSDAAEEISADADVTDPGFAGAFFFKAPA